MQHITTPRDTPADPFAELRLQKNTGLPNSVRRLSDADPLESLVIFDEKVNAAIAPSSQRAETRTWIEQAARRIDRNRDFDCVVPSLDDGGGIARNFISACFHNEVPKYVEEDLIATSRETVRFARVCLPLETPLNSIFWINKGSRFDSYHDHPGWVVVLNIFSGAGTRYASMKDSSLSPRRDAVMPGTGWIYEQNVRVPKREYETAANEIFITRGSIRVRDRLLKGLLHRSPPGDGKGRCGLLVSGYLCNESKHFTKRGYRALRKALEQNETERRLAADASFLR